MKNVTTKRILFWLRYYYRRARNCFMDLLPAKLHVQVEHLLAHGRIPDLKNPKTFNDKVAWRKLYDRDFRMPPLVDKLAAKEIMAAKFGADFVIPTLASYASETEVDFESLPYPCVIKANHASAMNMFLMSRPVDEKKARRTLGSFLSYHHHAFHEEWTYSQVPRCLIIEPYIEGGEHGLVDYKFFAFHGRVSAIQVDVDRFTGHRRAFYSSDWSIMPFVYGSYPQPSYTIPRPSQLRTMLHYAEQIGGGFSFARIDLYEIGGEVKFGEVTFYPDAGLVTFKPRQYDEILGEQWHLRRA